MTGDNDAAVVGGVLSAAGLAHRSPRFRRFDHGASGDRVFWIEGPRPTVAKIADRQRETLVRETGVLCWLGGRAGAPKLLWSGEVFDRPAMLCEGLVGLALHQVPPGAIEGAAIRAIAAMRTLHELPIENCPFDQTLKVKLEEARRRVEQGCVGEADFDAERRGRSAADVFNQLTRRAPPGECVVFAHGDASWPNFIIGERAAAGVVDLGRAGLADPYQDFALFLRSAARNAPELDAAALLKTHYPLPALDEERLSYYRGLDEFF